MSLTKNKYILLVFGLIFGGVGYALAVSHQAPKNVNLNTKEDAANRGVTALQRKVNQLEDSLQQVTEDLKQLGLLNEDLISRLDPAVSASANERNVVDTLDQDTSYVGDSYQVEFSQLTEVFSTDPSAQAAVASYFGDALVQRDQETDRLFESIPENPEWAGEANDFLNQQLTLDGAGLTTVDHSDCRDAICKVEFSMEFDDSVDPAIQESEMLIRLSKKFPKSRLSQTVEDGRVKYSGYLSDRSMTLPEEQHYLSDGRLTSAELQEIRSLLNR